MKLFAPCILKKLTALLLFLNLFYVISFFLHLSATDGTVQREFSATNSMIQREFSSTNSMIQREFSATNSMIQREFSATNSIIQREFSATKGLILRELVLCYSKVLYGTANLVRGKRGLNRFVLFSSHALGKIYTALVYL